MKSIEEIKIDLTLKKLSGGLRFYDIKDLPKDDELRTFVCSLGARWSFLYAIYVDKEGRHETLRAVLHDDNYRERYAIEVPLITKRTFHANQNYQLPNHIL